jgi:molecular chaperone GrpE
MDERTPSETEPESDAPRPLETEIEDLRRQVEDRQDKLLRALAETDNVRRRAQRDREEHLKYANESLIRDLIPVLDNLDRALAAGRGTSGAATVVEGVELIQRELLRVLEKNGLTRYSAVGQAFDPTRHEAIARVVSVDQPPNTVVAETAPGYMLHGRLLRPAMVAVAAPPDEDAA